MLEKLKKSLVLRIALPVIFLILGLGVMLDRFVLSVIADFTKEEIQRDLSSVSRRINNICNINFETLLMEGEADNADALVIKKALVLGQVEDLLVQEDLMGIVYDKALKEILVKTTLPLAPEEWMDPGKEIEGLKGLGMKAKGWFAFYDEFLPWGWQIIILKNEKAYSDLKTRVSQVHLNTLMILFFASILLIFFIHQTIKKPINTIIHPLKKGEKPDYKGIDAFEFLSDSITGMMESIKQSEEKYRSIVETTTGFVWEVDLKGRYTFISKTVKDILGYDPEELLNKSPFFTMPDNEMKRVAPVFQENAALKIPFEDVVNKNRHKQGRIVYLETRGVPVLGRDGELTGYRGVNKDITREIVAREEHEELERHRHQIQKLESIGTLAAGLAHDFNNLLSVIMGNVSLSKMEIKKDVHIIRFLAEAEAASIRAGKLAGQLITFSKGGMPVKTMGSIGNLLEKAARSILEQGRVTSLMKIQKDLFTVEYDPNQMLQVFENIILNAKEAMPNGGLVTIDAHNFEIGDSAQKVESSLPKGLYVKIMISDQGQGIEKQYLDKIFDPYFTTKKMGTKKGSGLGLTTAYSIISRHGGRIAVDSEPGTGTNVTLYFQAHGKETSDPDPIMHGLSSKTEKKTNKILLMDDEQMMRTLAEYTLKRLGYHPDTVKNGETALDRYQQALSMGSPFDLVILDLTVKDGMGGKDCIRKLMEIDPEVKAIVSSGYSTDPIMTAYDTYGFKLALPKPYNKNQMEAAIRQVLEDNE